MVLPHEDVIPAIVADRLAMMANAKANLEPILLVYDGDGATDEVIARTRAGEPLVDVSAPDGTTTGCGRSPSRPTSRRSAGPWRPIRR